MLFDAVAGIDVPPQRRRVGYVFQGYALFPHLTVRGQRGLRPPRPRPGRRGAAGGRGARARLGLEASRTRVPARAVGRPAPAGGPRPRARDRSRAAPARRAALRARPAAASGAARRAAQRPHRLGHRGGAGHPRPHRGLPARRPHRGLRGRARDPGGAARRAAVGSRPRERVARIMGIRNLVQGVTSEGHARPHPAPVARPGARGGQLADALVPARAGQPALVLHPAGVRAPDPQGSRRGGRAPIT